MTDSRSGPRARTTYLEHRIALPRYTATAAFDGVVEALVAAQSSEIAVDTVDGRLALRAPADPDGGVGWPLRSVDGSLRAPGLWRAVPVELELWEWGRGECVVGLRRLRGRMPAAWDGGWAAYEWAGRAVLRAVADLIDAKVIAGFEARVAAAPAADVRPAQTEAGPPRR